MNEYRPERIIDFHVHLFPDAVAPKAMDTFAATYGIPAQTDGTVSGTLDYMDRVGIDLCVPQPVATRPSQVRSINNWALSIRSDRIIPFGSLHPDYGEIAEEVDWLIDNGFRGIKLQPDWQEFYPDDEKAFSIYEAAEGRLAILFHAGREVSDFGIVWSTADRLCNVHNRFPGLKMIAAHMGGFRCWEDVESCLLGTGVYLDTSFSPEEELSDADMIRFIKINGVDKILFASDMPFGDAAKDIKRLSRLPFTDDEKESIAWRNGAEILDIA